MFSVAKSPAFYGQKYADSLEMSNASPTIH